MTRILVRAYRDPFESVSLEDVLDRDLFGGLNSGNLLFSDAAVCALAVEGNDLTCLPLDDQPLRAEEINEQFDHMVLPLANAFRRQWRRVLTQYADLIDGLTIPVTVLGVGAQSSYEFSLDPLRGLDDVVCRFVRAVLDRGPTIGVRGEFSAAYLSVLGFRDVEVIGCPSIFMAGRNLTVREPPEVFDAAARVALNLNMRLTIATAFFDRLVRRFPETTLFSQDHGDLVRTMWGSGGGNTPLLDEPTRLGQLLAGVPVEVHVDPQAWVAQLASYDFSLGTRIHGNIAAVLGGTPAHVIAHDSRTRELSEYLGIPHTYVKNLSAKTEIEDLADGNGLGISRDHQARFERYVGYLDRHGLPHRWAPDAAPNWERRRAGRRPTMPATSAPTQEELVQRLGWLKWKFEEEVQHLNHRVERQEGELKRLRRQVRRQSGGRSAHADAPGPET